MSTLFSINCYFYIDIEFLMNKQLPQKLNQNAVDDSHYQQGVLLDPRFSVFNRKKLRKQKRKKIIEPPTQIVLQTPKRNVVPVAKKIVKNIPIINTRLKEIDDDQREIERLTKKLGLSKNRPTKKMLALDGIDEELFDFLDHVEGVSRKKLDGDYTGFDERQPTPLEEGQDGLDQEDEFGEVEEEEEEEYDVEVDVPQEIPSRQTKVPEPPKPILKQPNQDRPQNQHQLVSSKVSIKEIEQNSEIEKLLKRNLNKLAEPNIDSIVGEILKIFEANPKQQSTQVFCQLFKSSTLDPQNIIQTQISCNTAVSSVIHQMYDNISFAEFIKVLVITLRDAHIDSSPWILKNSTLVICHWFMFDSIGIDFIKEYIFYLLQQITAVKVECLITLIQYCGKKIRADNPTTLKVILDHIVTQIQHYNDQETESKTKFLLMTLNDLRLNKKMNNDPTERLQFFTTWLKKQIIAKNNLTAKVFPQSFKMCFESNFENSNWWRPLAQQQIDKQAFDEQISTKTNITSQQNQALEKLAVEQKMMTETRKAIFKIIMGADDLYEAAQNLLRLQFLKKHKFEVALVAIELCGNENTYNPYYGLLCVQLFQLERGMRQQFQYAYWDKFKLLQDYTVRKLSNLSKLLTTLMRKKVASLQMLRWFTWDQLTPRQVLFLQILFWNFLQKADDAIVTSQGSIKEGEDSQLLREGLTQFLKVKFKDYVVKQTMTDDEEERLIRSTKLLLRVIHD